MQKPSIPKGMRDFNPLEMLRRNYIFDTIKSVYALYGYQQIETPTMEHLSVLTGKYGEEGDRLLFRVLNSGDFLRDVSEDRLLSRQSSSLAKDICDRGLRYDLTVPFARYVAMNREQISFPFRRYQIQPVWRADRPQRGRYREFYQCDADVIGSRSLLNEVELIQIIDEVFKRLDIRTKVLLNNRKILSGIAQSIGAEDKLVDITVAIDKLEKIGLDKVLDELSAKGFTPEQLKNLKPLLLLEAKNNTEKLDKLSQLIKGSSEGLLGIEELRQILHYLEKLKLNVELCVDISLARGLGYYTGAIMEVKALDSTIGSISGGGRYDNLTGIFGFEGMSGVGISFGADRIYDVLLEQNKFPQSSASNTKLMFVNFGLDTSANLLPLISRLRAAGIATELYPDAAKLKKQLSYANSLAIPYVALVGEDEDAGQSITIKNMQSGEQVNLSENKFIEQVKALGISF